MSDKDVINFQNIGIINTPQAPANTRARSFKISKVASHNYAQYVRTVKAYALAGMTFADIANAGDFLGDEVERKETDAPLKQDWKNMVGEVAEDESKVLAWQTRGEKATITPQLQAPEGVTGQELVIISKDLIVEQNPEQTIEVVEGIRVSLSEEQTQSLPTSTSDQALENNPYLQPIDFKK